MSDEEKKAPVQGYAAGIPWSLHLEAYDAYCKKCGKQQALIEGWCRGGFGTEELDEFIPGWREKVSEIGRLKAEIAELKQERERHSMQMEVISSVAFGHWKIGGDIQPEYATETVKHVAQLREKYDELRLLIGPPEQPPSTKIRVVSGGMMPKNAPEFKYSRITEDGIKQFLATSASPQE